MLLNQLTPTFPHKFWLERREPIFPVWREPPLRMFVHRRILDRNDDSVSDENERIIGFGQLARRANRTQARFELSHARDHRDI
jgi:hypothetical protein